MNLHLESARFSTLNFFKVIHAWNLKKSTSQVWLPFDKVGWGGSMGFSGSIPPKFVHTAASKIGNGVISLLWQLRCHCNHNHYKFPFWSNTDVLVIFQILVNGDVIHAQNSEVLTLQNPIEPPSATNTTTSSENAVKKMNLRSFKLYRVYLNILNLSKVGDFF